MIQFKIETISLNSTVTQNIDFMLNCGIWVSFPDTISLNYLENKMRQG